MLDEALFVTAIEHQQKVKKASLRLNIAEKVQRRGIPPSLLADAQGEQLLGGVRVALFDL